MVGRRRVTVMAGAGLVLLAGACATQVPPEVVESPAYQSGYVDGCTTGNRRIAGLLTDVVRNESLFQKDRSYAIGWRQGYMVCGGSQADQADRDYDYLTTDRFDQGPI